MESQAVQSSYKTKQEPTFVATPTEQPPCETRDEIARAERRASVAVSATSAASKPQLSTAEAIQLGKDVFKHHTGSWQPGSNFFRIDSASLVEAGGHGVYLDAFERFYEMLHRDPSMRTLFNESPEQRSAKEHGHLLGTWLLAHTNVTEDYYSDMRMQGLGHGLGGAHYRARGCPHRGAHAGRRFLRSQGFAWLGFLSAATDEIMTKECQKELKTSLMRAMATRVFDMYSPWVEDC